MCEPWVTGRKSLHFPQNNSVWECERLRLLSPHSQTHASKLLSLACNSSAPNPHTHIVNPLWDIPGERFLFWIYGCFTFARIISLSISGTQIHTGSVSLQRKALGPRPGNRVLEQRRFLLWVRSGELEYMSFPFRAYKRWTQNQVLMCTCVSVGVYFTIGNWTISRGKISLTKPHLGSSYKAHVCMKSLGWSKIIQCWSLYNLPSFSYPYKNGWECAFFLSPC